MPPIANAAIDFLAPAASFRRGWVRLLHRRLASTHPAIKWLFAVSGIAVVGYVDLVSGDEISFSIFYLLPIAYATWFIRLRAGLFIAVLGAVVWCAVELQLKDSVHPLISFWNGAVRLVFFVISVSAVALVKRTETRLLREVLRR